VNPPIYYLDTSALVKRYKTEQGSETINELFNGKSPDEVFVCSQFAAVEIEATLSRALKAKLLNRRAYAAILGRLAEDLSETIMMHPVSSAVLSHATELARRYALRAGDAVHMATALRVRRAALMGIIIVASDDELLDAVKSEGLEGLDPRRPDATEHLRRLRSEKKD